VLGVAAVISLVCLMGQWLVPFMIAFIIAYIFHVPVDMIVKVTKFSRTLSTGLVVLSLVAAVSVFTVFFVPLLKDALVTLIQKLPAFLQTFPELINTVLHDLAKACSIEYTFDIENDFKKYLSELTTELPNHIFTFINTGITLVYAVMFIFITPIITFYLLKDWHSIVGAINKVLARVASDSVLATLRLVNSNLAAYIKGQLVICAILAVMYSVGLELIGTDESVVCGILSGVCSVAPFFGPLIGLLISLVMSFDDFIHVSQYIQVVCLFVVVPFIDSNFITPKLIGRTTGIHPVGLLFMICATGSILGLSGIFIAVPLAVVLSTVCKELVRRTC
jgi:predicted PurR-regulated permease PerM